MTIEEMLELYEGPAADIPYDEVVNEREHALQTAELAIAAGAPDDAGRRRPAPRRRPPAPGGRVAADDGHEATRRRGAARRVRPGVAAPVALHVAAKRYLVRGRADVPRGLSAGSQWSLAEQGGPMTAAEVDSLPGRLPRVGRRRPAPRAWDDAAKVGAAVRERGRGDGGGAVRSSAATRKALLHRARRSPVTGSSLRCGQRARWAPRGRPRASGTLPDLEGRPEKVAAARLATAPGPGRTMPSWSRRVVRSARFAAA